MRNGSAFMITQYLLVQGWISLGRRTEGIALFSREHSGTTGAPLIINGRTEAEAEAPIFWPPDVKNWFVGKDPSAGKDLKQEEKGMTKDKIVEWHHRLNGHKFEQALGVDDGQGSLACCCSWGRKELDTTEWLNWGQEGRWSKYSDTISQCWLKTVKFENL